MIDPIWDNNSAILVTKENCGNRKIFLHGPTCTFWGMIRLLSFVTPNGLITVDILVKVLEYLNDLGVYNWSKESKRPVLIIDSHKYSSMFLKYINHKDTKQFILIGVPYLTYLWQIADSPQLNELFKANG